MVLSDKGGSLCVKDVFVKKFFGAGRDSAGGALASVRQRKDNGLHLYEVELLARGYINLGPHGL